MLKCYDPSGYHPGLFDSFRSFTSALFIHHWFLHLRDKASPLTRLSHKQGVRSTPGYCHNTRSQSQAFMSVDSKRNEFHQLPSQTHQSPGATVDIILDKTDSMNQSTNTIRACLTALSGKPRHCHLIGLLFSQAFAVFHVPDMLRRR